MNDRQARWGITRIVCVTLAVIVQIAVFGMMYFAAPRFEALYNEMYENTSGFHWFTVAALEIPGWGYVIAMAMAIGVVIGKEHFLHTTRTSVAGSITCIVIAIIIFAVFFAAVGEPVFSGL